LDTILEINIYEALGPIGLQMATGFVSSPCPL